MAEYRYEGNEGLFLVELLVLKAIGALDKQIDDNSASYLPMLEKKSGMVGASWDVNLMKIMDVDESYIEAIRSIWKKTQANHLAVGQVADPREFARQFVWTNYL